MQPSWVLVVWRLSAVLGKGSQSSALPGDCRAPCEKRAVKEAKRSSTVERTRRRGIRSKTEKVWCLHLLFCVSNGDGKHACRVGWLNSEMNENLLVWQPFWRDSNNPSSSHYLTQGTQFSVRVPLWRIMSNCSIRPWQLFFSFCSSGQLWTRASSISLHAHFGRSSGRPSVYVSFTQIGIL